MSADRSSVARLIAGNLVAAIVWMGVAFGVLEIFCRVKLDDGMRYEFEMWRYASQLKVPSENPQVSFTHRPNSHARIMGADVVINAQGLRDDRWISPEKSAQTTRILLLGDSVTFGFGVPLEQTTARVIERELNAAAQGNHFEVVNAGVGNYNTTMEVAYYFTIGRALSPDIVVLNFFVNDAEITPAARGNLLTRHSLAAVYLANRFDSASRWAHGAPGWQQYYLDLYRDDQPGWQRAQAAIRDLKEACERERAALVLVNYPDLHQTANYPLLAISSKIEKVARGLGVLYLDLLPEVANEQDPSRLWVHKSDPHPNGAVHERYGRLISDWLLREVLPQFKVGRSNHSNRQ